MNSQIPQEATDIFSISDQVLADRLQFIEEIGFGNWGSVWACRPKSDPTSQSTDAPHIPNTKIAVKLVHRSKTPTTAARVRSLWNEMKVVKSLKHEPHPSIIPFYSFIITPSYALITMAFHPRLVPVEVAEHHAKPWFQSLLSGVQFLHKHGVVHNDIKPANILLSADSVPVLVDFGFAERYDQSSSDAFHSNLSYGTPEYLSPERARGLPHDTRKSDVWSLGITFFEILVGRTPFEHSEGEQFSTKEDLEKYWSRTIRGKWVGTWNMSPSMERLLRRMISPNADLRYTSSEAMADRFWSQTESDAVVPSHKKSSSVSHLRSATETETSNVLPTRTSHNLWEEIKPSAEKTKIPVAANKENVASTPSISRERSRSVSALTSSIPRHKRSQSQATQASESRGVPQNKKAGRVPSLIATLSPIKRSPPSTNTTQVLKQASSGVLHNKENVLSASNGAIRTARKPVGSRKLSPSDTPSKKRPAKENREHDENAPVTAEKKEKTKRSRVLADITKTNRTSAYEPSRGSKQDTVSHRMREWERERQRLREMDLIEDKLREAEEERQRQKQKEEEEEEMRRDMERQYALELELERQRMEEVEKECQREAERQKELELERQREQELRRGELEQQCVKEAQRYPRINTRLIPTPSTPPATHVATPLSPLVEEPSMMYDAEDPSAQSPGLSVLKQSLKMSIDMTKRIYKSSTHALLKNSRDSSPTEGGSPRSVSDRTCCEDEDMLREVNSPLPIAQQAVMDDEAAAANQHDRMTIWIKNVEKVVEDARQSFAQASNTELSPLPVAPISRRSSVQGVEGRLSRSNHSLRAPRRILAANHIFAQENEAVAADNVGVTEKDQAVEYRRSWMDEACTAVPAEPADRMSMFAKLSDGPSTPLNHRRRATIGTRSPEMLSPKRPSLEIDLTPSKRREKSRSQNDLQMFIGRPITPVNRLEFEIEQLSKPAPVPRLSTLVDPGLFIGDASGSRGRAGFGEKLKVDDLMASPLHVEPYPARPASKSSLAVDTPAKKHLEGVYDRFLMSTTGVKRVGRGYQSDVALPTLQAPQSQVVIKRNSHFFLSARRPMPPPVSSDDLHRTTSFDEWGTKPAALAAAVGRSKTEESSGSTVGIVRRALKAMTVKRL